MEITNIIYIDHEKNWSFPLHQHNELEVSLILQGEGSININGKFYHLRKGNIAIKNAGAVHSEKSIGSQPLTQLCISIDGIDEKGYLHNQLISHDDSPIIDCTDHFDVLKSMGLYFKDHYEDDSLIINAMLKTFYLIMLAMINQQIKPQKRVQRWQTASMDEVIQYLDLNFQRSLSLDQLVSHFAISKFYLAKKFKEHTGTTIGRYLQE